MMTAAQMVSLPWGWDGSLPRRDGDDPVYFEIRIRELPDFFVAAPSKEEARANAANALEAFLEAYLSRGESVPLPQIAKSAELRRAAPDAILVA